MISYAQNFEDVMLWRALKHCGNGFYIDVGAWSPDVDSVTRHFYDSGWRGINIEPNPGMHRTLSERRPRDINLQLALSDETGNNPTNFLSASGLSTLDDGIALRHRDAGWELERHSVETDTLAGVWSRHVPAGQAVHFLKVDVEGLEAAVLRGNDWRRHRPWVVVVEATEPNSQIESHASWEPILLEADYLFAYADGLNRFYVAREHEALRRTLHYPPNVFDAFTLAGQKRAEAEAEQARAAARRHARQLDAALNSLSWRMTAPLRWVSGRLGR